MDTHKLDNGALYLSLKRIVENDPERILILDEEKASKAKDFLKRVDEISEYLIPNSQIGVVLNHDSDLIATLFAINKVGSAFVPVEPDFPDKRIQAMFEDADLSQVLTRTENVPRFNAYEVVDLNKLENYPKITESLTKKDQIISVKDPAYILFTSGTTGRPKGVVIRNENVLNYVDAFQNELHLSQEDRMLQNSVVSFDIFVEEVFASLLNGASLAIPTEQTKKDFDSLLKFMNQYQVTILDGFPYLLEEFNERNQLPESVHLLISGGDVLRLFQIDHLVDHAKVYNTYGPSETTVCASYFPVRKEAVLEDGTFPIGFPVKNVVIDVHREDGSLADPFEKGELWIHGKGVGSGYIKPVAESDNFQEIDGQTVYKSGDLGYKDENGMLYFLGRKDRQVMIDGRRVELSEVENVLHQLQEVEQAAVLDFKRENERTYMTAFYSGIQDDDKIRDYLSSQFPAYMIPEKIVYLEEFPLNDHGKADTGVLRQYAENTD